MRHTCLIALSLPVFFAGPPLTAQPPAETLDILSGRSRPPLRYLGASSAGRLPGIFPHQIKVAYGFTQIPKYGGGQTIAIVDAYDDPNAEADLAVFSTQFHLPACTTANGCFRKILAPGAPPDNNGWSNEIAIDTQWAHAIAPAAKILLVAAKSNNNPDLYAAVDLAVANGATVVSMSWYGAEAPNEIQADAHFNVTGVVFVAASGDSSHFPAYPAASPFVVGVGGTTLQIDASTFAWINETAWSGSSGGASNYEPQPSYQAGFQTTGQRGIPDVAYDGDPSTGVPAYNTWPCGGLCSTGWGRWGGTSIGTPQWAALFAIANSMRAAAGKAALTQPHFILYANAETIYHDVTTGNNGHCGAQCMAGPGYDFVTGLGSPQANLVIPALVAAP